MSERNSDLKVLWCWHTKATLDKSSLKVYSIIILWRGQTHIKNNSEFFISTWYNDDANRVQIDFYALFPAWKCKVEPLSKLLGSGKTDIVSFNYQQLWVGSLENLCHQDKAGISGI